MIQFIKVYLKDNSRNHLLADDVVVNGAELKDGMLVIDLEKIVPEEKKPRQSKLNNNIRACLTGPFKCYNEIN